MNKRIYFLQAMMMTIFLQASQHNPTSYDQIVRLPNNCIIIQQALNKYLSNSDDNLIIAEQLVGRQVSAPMIAEIIGRVRNTSNDYANNAAAISVMRLGSSIKQ